MSIFRVPLLRFLSLAALPRRLVLCWPQTFKELPLSGFPSRLPLVPSESGCKSTAFSITRNIFFLFFETFLYYIDYQYIKTLNFYKKASSRREKSGFSTQRGYILTGVYRDFFMILRSKQGFFRCQRGPFLVTPY